jgi:hypothetical protein
LKVSVVTWNFGQEKDNSDILKKNPEHFFSKIDTKHSDLICITGQEVVLHMQALDAIEKYLQKRGYVNVDTSFNAQWQMFLVVFHKRGLSGLISNVARSKIAQGKGKGLLANKGAMACSFALNGKLFNFIGGHLTHNGNGKRFVKRNKQVGELVRDFRLYPDRQSKQIPGLEIDMLCDFNFIAGDLNYRFNSTFDDYTARKFHPLKDFKTLDQLYLAY